MKEDSAFKRFYNKLDTVINSKIAQIFFVVFLCLKIVPLRMVDVHAHFMYSPIQIILLVIDVIICFGMIFILIKNNWFFIRIFICIYFYVLFTILATVLISKGDIFKCLFEMAQYLSGITIFFLISKKTLQNTYIQHSLFALILLLLFANLIFHIIHPNGISLTNRSGAYFLLDNLNDTPNYIFIYVFFLILLGYNNKHLFIPSIIFSVIFFGEIYFYNYSTGKIGVTIILLFGILSLVKKGLIIHKIPLFIYGIIPLILFLLIVVFRVQNLFEFVVVDVLHEDLTLHSRTLIWDYGLQLFSKHTLSGLGFDTLANEYAPIHRYMGAHSHCHCDYLEIMVRSGIIGFIGFFAPLISIFSKKQKYMDKEQYFGAITLGVLMIMAVAESVFLPITIVYVGYLLSHKFASDANEVTE